MIRVLVADDHPVVRNGLRAVLDLADDIEVVDDVGTVEQAVLRATEADVVLMDLQFGSTVAGVEATRRIRQAPEAPYVLVLTTFDAEADVLAALGAGAAGYLLKDAGPDELTAAVRRVVAGDTALSPAVGDRLVRRVQQPMTALSERELEVLALVAQGLGNAEVARALFLSQATVKTHLVHVFAKLGVDSRTAAVTAATERGLLRR
ncbi:MAG: response regulator transcription factor [Marmoricola sp.]